MHTSPRTSKLCVYCASKLSREIKVALWRLHEMYAKCSYFSHSSLAFFCCFNKKLNSDRCGLEPLVKRHWEQRGSLVNSAWEAVFRSDDLFFIKGGAFCALLFNYIIDKIWVSISIDFGKTSPLEWHIAFFFVCFFGLCCFFFFLAVAACVVFLQQKKDWVHQLCNLSFISCR